MPITRRTLLLTAAALPVGASALVDAAPAFAASAAGDVVGKITVGYQGWFACIGDGAPIDAWWHWSNNWAQAPSPSNNVIKAWPDMSAYTHAYQTGYAALGNGSPATLFSSVDQQVINTHCMWMQQNDIDTIALQRFDPNGSEGPSRNEVTAMLNTGAQAYGRKFYIMYDASGWTDMATEMPADWTANMAQYTSSSAYAHQNGKPVVGIWGFGFNDTNHPWPASDCLSVINWFKSQGCYVMGGVPTYWRTGVSDSRSGYLSTYSAFNMISPWMVGRIGTAADSDNFYTNVNVGDQAYCNANGIDYQPCVLPGDLSANQRAHGDFMWEQFYNMVRVGAQGIYISMFDEFGEGNQIVNTAPDQSTVPTNSGLYALNEDGTACSADYYMRLTGDGGRMLKGQIALTNVRPTQPVVGGTTPPPPANTNLALNKPVSASGYTQSYVPANTVDGNSSTYWESADNAFPQWLQVDLGAATAIGSITLLLPPSSSWATRTQTIQVLGSTDNSTFTSIVGATGYTFNPSTGNSVSITLPSTTTRYVRLNFTGNTGWPAGQISEFQVYAPSGSTTTTPPTAPSNLNANSVTYNSVTLTWTASTSSVGIGGYTVEKISGSTSTAIGTTSQTSYTVTGLSASTSYSFAVTAYDTSGNVSAASNTVNVTTSAVPNTNLALNKPASASGYTQSYVPANTVDGNSSTYWESTDNAFPQWLQVDLGSAVSIGSITLLLPPSSSWATRTQTIQVLGSTDNSTFTSIVGATGYTFNPSTGNSVSITLPSTTTRYVRLNFTANTGWPAGQISEFQVYAG